MEVIATEIPEVRLVLPGRRHDARGYFAETYNRQALAAAGIDLAAVQENQAFSQAAGTLRGLHFQCPPHAQAKLVRVVRGAIVDVAVDLRHGSPTYGRHVMVELTAASGRQLFVPEDFAHGTLTLLPETEIAYKVDAHHAPACEAGLAFDDPDLAIAWPLPAECLVLSQRDRRQPRLRDLPVYFRYGRA